MEKITGYIYIRTHSSYGIACKIGKATNIPERDSQYATGELKRGQFEYVFEMSKSKMGIVERLLHEQFRNYHIRYDAGTEFYDKRIMNQIEPYLITLGIEYRKLDDNEIYNLLRPNRVKQTIQKIFQTIRSKTNLRPRPYQNEIIYKSLSYFATKDKGMLVLMCGVGKTLISLWITKGLNAQTFIIGVPNKLLLIQWANIVNIVFRNYPVLQVSDGVSDDQINDFLRRNKEQCILITTYASSHKINRDFVFDMKILDEVHHLTKNKKDTSDKEFIKIFNIRCKKQLSLTATMKNVEGPENFIISNDDVEHFGEIIDRKCLLWAIRENIVCDYMIQTIIANEDQLNEHLKLFKIKLENDKRLFLSAYCSLKSISEGHSHHLLIYANCKENAQKIIGYINLLIEHRYFIFNCEPFRSKFDSEMTVRMQKKTISEFEKSRFGIISCVYCLGEGWDFPLLDGVVFSENMISNIRIVQSALRPGRKNSKEPNKKTKIILPVLNKDDWLDEYKNADFKKVKEVIYQMGLEDTTISQKIQVSKVIISSKNQIKEENQEIENSDFCEYDDELTNQLRLKTIKRAELGLSYEKAKRLIANKNICSKRQYFEICRSEKVYQDLPAEPEKFFKDQFKNWIDYLGIDRTFYDFETCRSKIQEFIRDHPYIRTYHHDLTLVCEELCKLDRMFPPSDLWVDYYYLNNLKDLIVISPTVKRKMLI